MAAPKNDKPFQEEYAHRPLKFKTADELEAKIQEYFDWCDNRIKTFYSDKTNQEVTYNNPAPYTMSGLAFFLDVDRRTLVNYSKREPYFPLIARARARIEQDLETRMYESRTPQGLMFGMKNNFTWIDESKSTIEANVKSKTELTPEAAAILAKASRAKRDATSKSN